MRTSAIALLAAAALSLAACGDDEEDAASTTPTATAPPFTTATTPSVPKTTTAAAASVDNPRRLRISKDVSKKPEIPKPRGAAPTSLLQRDIVDGKGRTARRGDMVRVHYVGVLFDTGEQFDASWDAERPFPFTLGRQEVIPGWDQGVAGMKVGGRRLLIIPPSLAYGSAGQGPIPPNATLVFVVDLLDVERG